MSLRSPQEVRRLCQMIFKISTADETEISINRHRLGLTRFANNMIHQHVEVGDLSIAIRAVIGQRSVSVSTNQSHPEILRRIIHSAVDLAKRQEPIKDLLPLVGRTRYPSSKAYVRRTAEVTPQYRAKTVHQIIKMGSSRGLTMAGSFSTGEAESYLAGSSGLFAAFDSTFSEFSVAALSGNRMGCREGFHRDVAKLDPFRLGEEAITEVTRGGEPRDLPPGRYPVLLTAKAAADLATYLSPHFGALAVEEGRSCFSGKHAQPVFASLITMTDDVFHPGHAGCPFDYEGTPKSKVTLVRKGVLTNLVHDRATAKKSGKRCTGHGLPVPNQHGPMAMNLVVAEGGSSFQQMVRTMKRGVWVSGLHYVNVVEPKTVTLTGMTKGTAFWIENGEVVYPVKTLRFNQSALEVLKEVDAVGSVQENFSGCVTPPLRTRTFSFTSGTGF